ncbi:MAG: hypothetical protein N3A02_06040 [Rectinema sp.]|nr:hypothetical protein [Rectinema sp.]
MSFAITPAIMKTMAVATAANYAAQGISQIRMGSLERDIRNYNANAIMENAAAEAEASNAEFMRLLGQQRNLYGASGVDVSSGSPLMTYMATMMAQSREQSAIMNSAARQARLQRIYGRSAMTSGVMTGMQSFITGLGGLARDILLVNSRR